MAAHLAARSAQHSADLMACEMVESMADQMVVHLDLMMADDWVDQKAVTLVASMVIPLVDMKAPCLVGQMVA